MLYLGVFSSTASCKTFVTQNHHIRRDNRKQTPPAASCVVFHFGKDRVYLAEYPAKKLAEIQQKYGVATTMSSLITDKVRLAEELGREPSMHLDGRQHAAFHDAEEIDDDGGGDDDKASMTSTEILASSPLYYVLQEFLLSQSGSTITDELAGIAQSLHSISRSMSIIARARDRPQGNKASSSSSGHRHHNNKNKKEKKQHL